MDLHDPDECENLAFKSCHESVIPGAQQVWSLSPFYSVDFFGKTQFVLFGRMQFVLKVCSMHEVIVCSTGFSLFYQKTEG